MATIQEEVNDEAKTTEEIKSNYTIRPQFHDLLAVNERIVGWIAIDDTKLNNPILQAEDNDFYLTHNF
ncbi:SrtB family sortase OS=Lysinibacillus sphaericus OX=1421 GN=LS41612_19145 PE=4 SV=1 [Lysinibacillus sphaericus]